MRDGLGVGEVWAALADAPVVRVDGADALSVEPLQLVQASIASRPMASERVVWEGRKAVTF